MRAQYCRSSTNEKAGYASQAGGHQAEGEAGGEDEGESRAEDFDVETCSE